MHGRSGGGRMTKIHALVDAIATRYEKHAETYLALIKLASAKNLAALYGSVTSPNYSGRKSGTER